MTTSSIVELSPLLHPLFSNIMGAPKTLWIEGRPEGLKLIERLPDHGLAVVGTRSPDRRSVFLIQETMRRLRGTSLIIISGLARGIDAAAHESALSADLPTIAVLGCGINRTYPAENYRLRKRIIDAGGLVLSELPPDLEPYPGCFIQRNRIIAGMAKASWIVQSGYRSGALNTATWTLKQQRTLFATPSFPGDPSFLGNENLLMKGDATALYSAENLVTCWIGLFSDIIQNKRNMQNPPVIDLILEIENGMREGKELVTVIEERSRRTGEPVDDLIKKIERGMLT